GSGEVAVRFDEAEEWVSLARRSGGRRWLALFNFAKAPRVLPTDGMERLMLSTDDSAYGGAGVARLDGGRAHLPGRTAVLLGPEDV
ncbi:MAG: DUF3459 domain-containing protein, partial [Gemmatimonadales bacterium]